MNPGRRLLIVALILLLLFLLWWLLSGRPDPLPRGTNDANVVTAPPGDTARSVPSEADTRTLDPAQGRSCRSEIILVDVPFGVAVPQDFAATTAAVRDAVRSDLSSNVPQVFFSDCAAADFRVDIQSVFGPNDELIAAWNAENFDSTVSFAENAIGNRLRHQKVEFFCGNDPTPLKMRPARHCFVLSVLGQKFANISVNTPVDIARDCDARAQADWYQESIGPIPTPPVADTSKRVRVVVADTPPEDPNVPESSPHGDTVTRLIEATINDQRVEMERVSVLPEGPGGATSYIASQLAAYVASATPDSKPTVLNMSFGWPPEMGVRSLLKSGDGAPACEFTEGGTGAAVRSALRAFSSRMSSVPGTPPPLIFAAIGNRNRNPVYPPGVVLGVDPCGPVARDGEALPFFPAAWARNPSPNCRDRRLLKPIVMSVGAHGLESTNSKLGVSTPDFYAPGWQLPMPTADGSTQLGSGTSYATAVASGAAARILMTTPVSRNDFIFKHTCAWPQRPFQRLRYNGNAGQPCQVPNLTPPPASVSAQCPGTDCTVNPTDVGFTEEEVDLTLAPGDPGQHDNHALGLAAPQPWEPGCPECKVTILPGYGKFEFLATIASQIKAATTAPYITSGGVAIIKDGDVWEYDLGSTWIGGQTYQFTSLVLPSDLATASDVYSAKFFFRYKLQDGSATGWYDEPLELQLPLP